MRKNWEGTSQKDTPLNASPPLRIYTRWNLRFVNIRFQTSTHDLIGQRLIAPVLVGWAVRSARVVRARSCTYCVYRVHVITRRDLLNRLIVTARARATRLCTHTHARTNHPYHRNKVIGRRCLELQSDLRVLSDVSKDDTFSDAFSDELVDNRF